MRQLQMRLRESGKGLGLLLFKTLTGFFLGLTLALIIQQLTQMGRFGFLVVIVFFVGAFYKMSKPWKTTGIVLFNLFCIMSAMLVRMYILIAPGE